MVAADDSTMVYPRAINMIRITLIDELLGLLPLRGKQGKITPRVL